MEQNKETINWEQRHYEIAKGMLLVIYAMDECDSENGKDYLYLEQATNEAVRYADALIERLKEKGGQQ